MEKEHETPLIVTIPDPALRRKAADIPAAHIRAQKIQRLIAEMKITLAATPDGVGLAAPQAGKSLRLFVVSEEAQEIDRSATDIARAQRQGTSGTLSREYRSLNAGQLRQRDAGTRGHGYGLHALNEPQLRQRDDESRKWRYFVFINPVVKNRSRKQLDGPEGCLSVPGKFGTVQRHEKITVEALDEHGKKFTRGSAGFFARVVQHELDHLEGILFIDKAEGLIDAPLAERREKAP